MRYFVTLVALALCSGFQVHASTASSFVSPEELRQAFLEFRKKHDVAMAMSLYCSLQTDKEIVDMYRRDMQRLMTLPVVSVEVQAIPSDRRPTMEHTFKPIGRLLVTFDSARQSGVIITEQFFFFGKKEGRYCLTLPKI